MDRGYLTAGSWGEVSTTKDNEGTEIPGSLTFSADIEKLEGIEYR